MAVERGVAVDGTYLSDLTAPELQEVARLPDRGHPIRDIAAQLHTNARAVCRHRRTSARFAQSPRPYRIHNTTLGRPHRKPRCSEGAHGQDRVRVQRQARAVDDAHQVIVAAQVSQCAADVANLIPMTEQAAAYTGAAPEQVLADAGYCSADNLDAATEFTDQHGSEFFIATGRTTP